MDLFYCLVYFFLSADNSKLQIEKVSWNQVIAEENNSLIDI